MHMTVRMIVRNAIAVFSHAVDLVDGGYEVHASWLDETVVDLDVIVGIEMAGAEQTFARVATERVPRTCKNIS
jgi:hypothetical protein